MSRIYDDQSLKNLPLINKTWISVWNPKQWMRSGEGVLVEGSIENRHKICITDSASSKSRYFILQVRVSRAHRRKFDSKGQEMEPNFSQTTKVSTGFLNSSYKVEAKGTSDCLSVAEVLSLLTLPDLTPVTKDFADTQLLTLFLPEALADNIELASDAAYRIKTEGNSPFVCSIALQEGEWKAVSNFAGGEGVGASWTDKVMAVKSTLSSTPADFGDDVVADEEWDD